MGKKLTIAPSARRDSREIVQEIARDALLDRATQASEFPQSGRIVPEFRDSNLRELIHTPIRIIYRLRPDDTVEVVRFWHASRGQPST